MQIKPSREIPEDEIDVQSILLNIYKFVAYPFVLLYKNIKTTLLFLLLAVCVCFYFKHTMPKLYKSSFIILPANKKEVFHINILRDVKQLIKNKDTQTLANELKTTTEITNTLVEIEIKDIKERAAIDSSYYTEITLIASDYNQFIPLQTSLLLYLNSNIHYNRIQQIVELETEERIEDLNNEIIEIDSLKKTILRSINNKNNQNSSTITLAELQDPSILHTLSLNLRKEKINLSSQKKHFKNFELIKSCVIFKNHFSPRLWKIAIIIIPFFMLFCFLFLHFKKKHKQKN